MLPRKLRLSRKGFATRGLLRAASRHFSLSYGPSADGGAAAVVSKKVERSAVKRHLLKRRILHSIRPYVRADHALIVYARAGAGELTAASVRDELNSLLGSILPTP